jgi:mannose-6-phosphate isomerase-like protein (cupin superfamily)
MVETGASARSPRGTIVEVVESRPDRFLLRRTLPPRTGRTAPHRHLDGVERFRVLEGSATGRVGANRRRLGPGEVMEVPAGSMHVHPHTSRGETAVIEHEIEPQVTFVQVYFPSWMAWLAEGRVDRQDEPRLLAVMAISERGGGGTYIAGLPVRLQERLVPRLAAIARRRGYRAVAP